MKRILLIRRIPENLFIDGFFEEILEELDLIDDGVIPVSTVVCSRTDDEVVAHLLMEEAFVYGLVYAEEEIIYSAIDDDGQVAVLQAVQLVDDRVVVPYFQVFIAFAEVVLHAPVVGEGTDVETSAGSACGTEHFLVTDSIPHCTVSAHAQARDGSLATVGDGIQVLVRVFNQFLGYEGFVAAFRYHRAVPIPAVAVAVGQDEDDAVSVGYFGKVGTHFYPRFGVSAVSVEQVDDGAFLALHSLVGADGYYLDVLVHAFTTHHQGIDLCGLQAEAGQEADTYCAECSFHHIGSFLRLLAQRYKKERAYPN